MAKKKSSLPIVLIITGVLLLCCIVASIAGGLIWYFVLRSSVPEEAYTETIEKNLFEKYDYVQYESYSKFTVGYHYPSYPEGNSSRDEERLISDGMFDIQNHNIYEYQDEYIRYDSEEDYEYSDTWEVDGTLYVRTDGGKVRKFTPDGDSILRVFSVEVINTLTGNETAEYEGEEEINGVDCYRYSLELDDSHYQVLIDWFHIASLQDMVEESIDTSLIALEDTSFHLWISKNSNEIMKARTTCGRISYPFTVNGIEGEVYYEDFEAYSTFSNWGEPFEVEAPI